MPRDIGALSGEARKSSRDRLRATTAVNRGLATHIHGFTGAGQKTSKPKNFSTESSLNAARKGMRGTRLGHKFGTPPSKNAVNQTHKRFVASGKAHNAQVAASKAVRVRSRKSKAG